MLKDIRYADKIAKLKEFKRIIERYKFDINTDRVTSNMENIRRGGIFHTETFYVQFRGIKERDLVDHNGHPLQLLEYEDALSFVYEEPLFIEDEWFYNRIEIDHEREKIRLGFRYPRKQNVSLMIEFEYQDIQYAKNNMIYLESNRGKLFIIWDEDGDNAIFIIKINEAEDERIIERCIIYDVMGMEEKQKILTHIEEENELELIRFNRRDREFDMRENPIGTRDNPIDLDESEVSETNHRMRNIGNIDGNSNERGTRFNDFEPVHEERQLDRSLSRQRRRSPGISPITTPDINPFGSSEEGPGIFLPSPVNIQNQPNNPSINQPVFQDDQMENDDDSTPLSSSYFDIELPNTMYVRPPPDNAEQVNRVNSPIDLSEVSE